MNIIIDGYNLLKNVLKNDTISQKERNWFHARALSYANTKGHKLYIVYDGGSLPRPETEKKGSLVIVFSGYKQSADDIIKAYIDEKILKNMLIVTTDRQLNRYAGRAQIPSIDSLDFYKLMKESERPATGIKKMAGPAHKILDESTPELDALMQEGSAMLFYKIEEDMAQKSSQKGNKKDRIQKALIKKL